MATFIGIDLGTSAVKTLLLDENGTILNIVSKEYPLYFPKAGWSEQNPQDWYIQTAAAVRELVADFDASQVAGISFGGQMHGLVVLDKEDAVIRPAILWNDGRTQRKRTISISASERNSFQHGPPILHLRALRRRSCYG